MSRSAGRFRRYTWLPVAASLFLVIVFLGTHRSSSAASARPTSHAGAAARQSASRLGIPHWIAVWSTSPEPAARRVRFSQGFENQTIREIVFTSAAGSTARVRLSNAYGREPLVIARAALGDVQDGAGVARQSDVPLAFGGRPSVVIPPGRSVVSDDIRFRIRRFESLDVSVYLRRATGPPTCHWKAAQINYVAAGDHVLDPAPGAFRSRTTSSYFVTGIDVLSSRPGGTVVAFGDSITDGAGSRTDANARWPNDLARRLRSLRGSTVSVVDEGLSGNRVLTPSRWSGESGLARFGRDVLHEPSATAVIVLEGVNDLGATRNVTAGQIIAGYERLIAAAHAAGLMIFGGTLTPFRGAGYWTAAGEAKREAINAWIRDSGAFDGVIDFASAVQDPRDPERFAPAYDSGDHLHPNDAGYRAMADAVSLSMLMRAAAG